LSCALSVLRPGVQFSREKKENFVFFIASYSLSAPSLIHNGE
jgi:hypothetical protein